MPESNWYVIIVLIIVILSGVILLLLNNLRSRYCTIKYLRHLKSVVSERHDRLKKIKLNSARVQAIDNRSTSQNKQSNLYEDFELDFFKGRF